MGTEPSLDRTEEIASNPIAQHDSTAAQQLADLTALTKIVGIGSKALSDLAFTPADQASGLIRQALQQVAILAGSGSELSYYRPLPNILTADAYILPLPLEPVYGPILAELASPIPSPIREDAGLLLLGRPGSGKTEFPQFLASSTAAHVEFVTLNASTIRGAQNPALVLESVYLDLQDKAKREGKRYVLVLDEFDQLVTANASIYRNRKVTTSESGNDRRFSASSTDETTSDLHVDGIGQSLLNTLKTLLGSDNTSHVYTIATTNVTDLPDAIFRDGRLRRIHVDALATLDHQGRNIVFLNDWYRDCVPRILKIMDATHFRKNGDHNYVLGELRAKIENLFAEEPNWLKIYAERKAHPNQNGQVAIIKERDQGDFSEPGFITAEENARPRNLLFQLLTGMEIKGLGWGVHLFGTGLETDWSDRSIRKPEIAFITSVTPSRIRQHYLTNEAPYSDMASAKSTLAKLLFPQILESERRKAANA